MGKGEKKTIRVIEKIWIALAIGNSRYHWAWFLGTQLQASWDTAYLNPTNFGELLPIDLIKIVAKNRLKISQIEIYFCSVVSTQIAWQQLPQVNQITLTDIPLLNLYPTLGIDRALTLLGAGERYGYPALVIDGGTALTITGVNRDQQLVGGAIMLGVKLQLHALASGTAALPEITLPDRLPTRWSNNTQAAIASGVLFTLSSGIRDFILDWWRLYPDSQVIFTGGDGEILLRYLSSISEDLIDRISFDRQLIFDGFVAVYSC